MRDPKRIERIVPLLAQWWRTHPDLRLTQLVINLTGASAAYDTYFMEDDELERRLRQALREGKCTA